MTAGAPGGEFILCFVVYSNLYLEGRQEATENRDSHLEAGSRPSNILSLNLGMFTACFTVLVRLDVLS
jgi:hypothetical protein